MLKKKWSLKKRPFHREVILNWVSGILIVMYAFTFVASLITSWVLPGNTAMTVILEQWRVALTPLVAAIVHRYIRQRNSNNNEAD